MEFGMGFGIGMEWDWNLELIWNWDGIGILGWDGMGWDFEWVASIARLMTKYSLTLLHVHKLTHTKFINIP
jgi:hypothetical protein